MGNNKSINSSSANHINKTAPTSTTNNETKPKIKDTKKNRANDNKENILKTSKPTKKDEQIPQTVESEYTNINEYSESIPKPTNTETPKLEQTQPESEPSTKRFVEESFYESTIDMDYTSAPSLSAKQPPAIATYVSIDEEELKRLNLHDSDLLYSQVNVSKAHKNNQAQLEQSSGGQFKKNKAKKFFNFNKPKATAPKSELKSKESISVQPPAVEQLELPKKCFDPTQEFIQQQNKNSETASNGEIYQDSMLNRLNESGVSSGAENNEVQSRLPPSSLLPRLPDLPPPPIHTMPVLTQSEHLLMHSTAANNQNSDEYQSVPEYEYIASMKSPEQLNANLENAPNDNEHVAAINLEVEIEEEEEEIVPRLDLANRQRPPPPPASTLPSRLSQNVESLTNNQAFTTIEPFNMNNQVYYSFTSPEARSNFGLQVNSNNNNINNNSELSSSSYSSSSPKTSSSQSSSSAPSPSDRFVNTINVVDNKFDHNERQQHKVVCQVGDNKDQRRTLYIKTANFNGARVDVVNNNSATSRNSNSNRYSVPAANLNKTNNQEKYILKL